MGRRAILIAMVALPCVSGGLLPIHTYTTADGLAGDRVECIVPDSRGFLWFCSTEGLSRFDGSHFVSYGVAQGLPHQNISAFMESQSGDRWVATARGLSRITSGEQSHFSNYVLGNESGSKNVVAIAESPAGKIWCATRKGLYERTSPGIFQFVRDPQDIYRLGITTLAADASGDLWIGTTGGLFRLHNGTVAQSFTMKEGLPGNWINTLQLDSKGRLWAGIRGGVTRMSRQASGGWTLERSFDDKSGIVSNDVTALLEASDGSVWIGTSLGLSHLKLETAGAPVFENFNRSQGLSDHWVLSLAEDQAGNIWAGTEGAGVMRIARDGFTTFHEQDGLAADRVMAIFESRAAELIALTAAGSGRRSVEIFDGSGFRQATPQVFVDHASWGWNQVLLQSRTGEWWAATNDGPCRFAPRKAADLKDVRPAACYLKGVTIFRIFEDSKGGIWASGQSYPIVSGDRLIRWDPETNTIFEFKAPRIPNEPSDDMVSSFAEDRRGNIWMGLLKGGLYRFDGKNFRYFRAADGVPAGGVLALLADTDGLWIGSNSGGLGYMKNCWDEHPKVAIYDMTRGLASNSIRCLVNDRQGRIYAGTGKGVDRFDPKTGHIRHFSSADGLAHGDIFSAARDGGGSLWFATTQGLSRLTLTADRPALHPRVLITDLQVAGRPYAVSQLGETHISRLELNPSQNQLQIEFVGIDYEPSDIVRYSFKLEGADEDWSPPRDQHSVNYASLAAGHYRFFVKAVTSEGAETDSPAVIEFNVLPPVWKRWWFQSLAVLAVIALVIAAHRYRVAQLVSLERMRTTIATDLHDDIGASLSQIAILSEVARVGASGRRPPGDPLERVATLAREVVDSMSDIVWSIRSEPHSVDSLITRMRQFALDLLGSQGIEFQLKTAPGAENIALGLKARRQLLLIFKEAVHNAARHSHCSSVVAQLELLERELVLTINDNGEGLNSDKKGGERTGGTGVPSMRSRAESVGGRVDLISSAGQGCTVVIHVPANRGKFVKTSV